MKNLRKALGFAAMALVLTACVPSDFYSIYQPQQYAPAPAAPEYTAPAYYGLPKNYAEFRDRCQSACQSPRGAAKMYFDAVFCYMDKSKRSEASKMLRFIMHADAPHLDGQYAAFGKVVSGMDVVDEIADVAVDYSDRPRFDMRMKRVYLA